MTLLEIFAEAAALPDADIEQLIDKLRALRSLGKGKKRGAAADDGGTTYCELYNSLRTVAATANHVLPPYPVFLARNKKAKQFEQARDDLVAWLRPLLPNQSPITYASVTKWIAGMIVQRAAHFKDFMFGIVVTMQNFPQLLDERFPGYVASGLLPWAINTRTKGTPNVRPEPSKKERKQR